MLVSLLWCSASMQTCVTSSTQANIKFNVYNNRTASEPYLIANSIHDSSGAEYVTFQLGSDPLRITLRIAKIGSDGTLAWAKLYSDISSTVFRDSIQLSTDENTLMVAGFNASTEKYIFANIRTGNLLSFLAHILIFRAYLSYLIKIVICVIKHCLALLFSGSAT